MFTCSLESVVAYVLFGIGLQHYDDEKGDLLYLLGINKFQNKLHRLKTTHFVLDRILDN
jgi:hypothetical protein